jgi:hypothetical protein
MKYLIAFAIAISLFSVAFLAVAIIPFLIDCFFQRKILRLTPKEPK